MARPSIPSRHCLECDAEFLSRRREQRFHSAACSKAFHRRRMLRGAQLYDLVMQWQIDGDERAHGTLCGLAGLFRQEDLAKKQARSWLMPSELDAPRRK